MANSTEEGNETDFLQYLIPYACLVLLSLAGLLIQSFIVAVNVIDWMKGRAITGAIKIITSIGISRIFLHTAYLMYIVKVLCSSCLPEIIRILNELILSTSDFANIWLSTLLSIFFYFNISTSQNIVILHLKATISRRVTYLIIASVLLSVVYPCMFYFGISEIFRISTHNDTLSYRQEEIIPYVYIMWTSIPLLMISVASLLLIILLAFHLSRMKIHGNMTSSTEPYYRTLKFTVVSFLFCATYMLEHLSKLGIPAFVYFWLLVIMNIFLVLHSVLLIYVVTKLRNQFFRIFHYGSNFLRNRKSPGPQSRAPEEEIRL